MQYYCNLQKFYLENCKISCAFQVNFSPQKFLDYTVFSVLRITGFMQKFCFLIAILLLLMG